MTRDRCAFSCCTSAGSPRAAVRPWQCCGRQHARPGFLAGYRWRAHHFAVSLLCCLLLLCRGTGARQIVSANALSPRPLLLFDRGPAPPLPRMYLEARSEPSDLASTTIRPSGSGTATGSVQIATETSTTLPRLFDSNIGNNFTTTSCPTFFDSFLSNQTLIDCLPLSLLLQTSNSFFTASRSVVRLTTTLDATCRVDFSTCSALMAGLTEEVKQESNCGADLRMGNPTVLQAYNGFVAYDALYSAGCLQDDEGRYCYANAVTNVSAPTSGYIYYLPLGVPLPGGSRPACTTCLQNTMAIFAQAAANTTQPLHADYQSAAEQVQMGCGPTFVHTSVETASFAAPRAPSWGYLVPLTILALVMNSMA